MVCLLPLNSFLITLFVNSFSIKKVEAWPVDLPLKASFVVANGAMDVAENIFVRVTLYDGSVGYGEVAPFPDISGKIERGALRLFLLRLRCYLANRL